MRENTKAPVIRFKGFNDAWEQRKLCEISSKVTEKNISMTYTETFTNSAEFGIISQLDYFDHDISNSENLNGYYVVNNDDFVYNPRISTFAPVGPINRNKLGRNGVMSPLYTVFRTHNIDNTFLEQYFKSRYWHTFMKLNGDSGARADRFSIRDSIFVEMPIPYPVLQEQKEIGIYLTRLDNLITLHQRKFNKLKNIKKAMLEKMFPKNGCNVPEIRFNGFTDAWEQRKLGDVCCDFEYGLNASAKSFDGMNKYIRITDIDDSSHRFKNDDLTSPDTDLSKAVNYKLSDGDILFARTGASVGKTYIYRDYDGLVYYAGFLIRAKIQPDYDLEFIFQNTLTSGYDKFIRITSQRSGQPGVNAQEYREYQIYAPSKMEQVVIGAFFANLDNLITLHQRKLDKLQNVKKSCLEKMFI